MIVLVVLAFSCAGGAGTWRCWCAEQSPDVACSWLCCGAGDELWWWWWLVLMVSSGAGAVSGGVDGE